MRSMTRNALLAFGLLATCGLSPSDAADPVSADRFAKLHALVKPQAGEDKWAEIPWMTSLWDARKRAAAEGKPILLWEMDGHPLACV